MSGDLFDFEDHLLIDAFYFLTEHWWWCQIFASRSENDCLRSSSSLSLGLALGHSSFQNQRSRTHPNEDVLPCAMYMMVNLRYLLYNLCSPVHCSKVMSKLQIYRPAELSQLGYKRLLPYKRV
jgi:hypothetical protein